MSDATPAPPTGPEAATGPAEDDESVPAPNPDGATLAQRAAGESDSSTDPMPDAAGTGS